MQVLYTDAIGITQDGKSEMCYYAVAFHSLMTSQRLYGILKLVDSLDQKLGLQTHLEAIRDALSQLVNSPAQPNLQSALASALSAFGGAVVKMAESLNPSQVAAIAEMGGTEFFDPGLAEKVITSIQTNAMTPSVARGFVQDVATRRAAFLATVRSARQALEELGITESDLKPGAADVAFLIPREIFDNELGPFAKELAFISRLVQDFTEPQTGKADPVILEQLSSSVPTVALIAALPALNMLGIVINKFLDAWKKIEEIRQMRAKLAEMGLTGKAALQELTDEITTTVDTVVEESTVLVMAEYKGNRGDLENAIRSDVRRLFGQIERGLAVEFRAEPYPDADGQDQRELQQIATVAKVLQFPKIAHEPLLLESKEVLEDATDGNGQVIKHTKKTTTHKTTRRIILENDKKE
jgi:hypothetical protein